MKLLLILFISLFSLPALAEEPKTLEQLQKEEKIQEFTDQMKQLRTSLKALVKSRRLDCMKAIGYTPFCDCIMKGLPVAWGFSDYIAITTRSKEENGYGKLDAEYQAAYDKVSSVRDTCVQRINVKP